MRGSSPTTSTGPTTRWVGYRHSRIWRASHRAQSPTMRGPLDGKAFHGTHSHRRGILPGPMGADGAPGAPPTPNRIRMSAEKACFSAGVALPAGKRGRVVSQAFSPDVRPRRSPRRRVSDLAGLAGTVQGSWSSSGPGAEPGRSAEFLASHFRRIADPARLTPPPDLRFPRHASMCGPLTLGRPLNRISVLRRTGGSPSTYVLVWQHGPVTISGQGPKGSHAYVSFRHRRGPYHRFWFASHWSCCRSRR